MGIWDLWTQDVVGHSLSQYTGPSASWDCVPTWVGSGPRRKWQLPWVLTLRSVCLVIQGHHVQKQWSCLF